MINRTWIVAASLAAMFMAACAQPEQVIVVVTATPTPEERVGDKLARNVASPTPSPVADTPTPPPTSAPAPANTPTPLSTSTPIPLSTSTPIPLPTETPAPTSTTTPVPTSTPIPTRTPVPVPTDTPMPTSTPIPTNTPTPMPTSTPIPTNTPTPVPTSTPTNTPTPVPTNTPMPTNTPTPTNTPVPVVKLLLDAESTVLGYWSDGTADVEVTATLRNDGTLRLDRPQDITATCVAQSDERRECREELSLALPDGFTPASTSFVLRLPMGATTTLALDYGEHGKSSLDIDVPERILGIDRDVYECYVDRPSKGWSWDTDDLLCGTMTSAGGSDEYQVVEKWLSDIPVKVWATGPSNYISHLRSVLSDISAVSGLEFEWVDSRSQSDFRAYVGLSKDELLALSDFKSVDALHGWGGLATWRGRGRHGEITSGTIWTKRQDNEISRRGVILHETLHALVPMHHSNRPLSMMGCCSVERMSPMDIELIKLNYNPLIRPGMTMDEVRELVVLTDELLDYPMDDSPSYTPMDLVWRIYTSIIEADAIDYQLEGGWCNDSFSNRRGPIRIVGGGFLWWADVGWVFYDFNTVQFYAFYDRETNDWLYFYKGHDGDWKPVNREFMTEYSGYWHWDGKLTQALRFILLEGQDDRLDVTEVDGVLHIQVRFDRDFGHRPDSDYRYFSLGDVDSHIDLVIVVNSTTLELIGYTWTIHRKPDNWCWGYVETATNFQLGIPDGTPTIQDFQ